MEGAEMIFMAIYFSIIMIGLLVDSEHVAIWQHLKNKVTTEIGNPLTTGVPLKLSECTENVSIFRFQNTQSLAFRIALLVKNYWQDSVPFSMIQQFKILEIRNKLLDLCKYTGLRHYLGKGWFIFRLLPHFLSLLTNILVSFLDFLSTIEF